MNIKTCHDLIAFEICRSSLAKNQDKDLTSDKKLDRYKISKAYDDIFITKIKGKNKRYAVLNHLCMSYILKNFI